MVGIKTYALKVYFLNRTMRPLIITLKVRDQLTFSTLIPWPNSLRNSHTTSTVRDKCRRHRAGGYAEGVKVGRGITANDEPLLSRLDDTDDDAGSRAVPHNSQSLYPVITAGISQVT